MKDAIGDRMKSYYENITRYYLPRRTYVLLRIDGKAFHTYTEKLIKPFDDGLIDDMNNTAKFLCEKIQGAKFAYVQSDEISIVLTDFTEDKPTKNTEAWFDNNLQKICSISASLATSEFNKLRIKRSLANDKDSFEKILNQTANFDSRVWTIPKRSEVLNYFIYRQQDATRNSIQSVAQSMFNGKSSDAQNNLKGKSTNKLQEMIYQKDGTNWNNFPSKYKRGRGIMRLEKEVELNKSVINKATEKVKSEWILKDGKYYVIRKCWDVVDVPIFTQNKTFFENILPTND